MTYVWLLGVGPPTCPADFAKPLTTAGHLNVAGKGTIIAVLSEGARCAPFDLNAVWVDEPQRFTIAFGTGLFIDAFGTGIRERRSSPARPAIETWTGTLEVPSLAPFDVTAPKLRGASPKTARAQRGASGARVTFEVSAIDDIDGRVRASCQPRSGGFFKVGRTTVRCTATDSSGNTGKAEFHITVKRRR